MPRDNPREAKLEKNKEIVGFFNALRWPCTVLAKAERKENKETGLYISIVVFLCSTQIFQVGVSSWRNG